jgi:PAS domain S-box-containing protein
LTKDSEMETSADRDTDLSVELIIDSIAEPIMVINNKFEIKWMNRSAREFLLGDDTHLRCLVCYKCYHGKDRPCDGADHDCPLQRCRTSHEPFTVIHEHFRSDGQERLLEIVSSPLWSKAGAFEGIIQVARDITDKKKMAEQINLFASIIQTIPDPICSIDLDGIIRTWNEGAEKLLGYKEEELLGKPVTMVIPGDELDGCLNVLNTAGFFTGYESVRISKDGRVIPVEVTGVSIKDKDQKVIGYASIMRDVTERKAAEEALGRSEEYFRAVTENASDIITILDAKGILRYASHSIERILGYGKDDLIGRNVFELVHPDDNADAMKIFATALQKPGIPLSLRVRFQHKNGTWRILEVIGENLLDNPAVRGIVVNSRDITEREHAAQELRETTEELARSNADLLQFAYAASHDLQAPLGVIEGFIRLLSSRYKNKLDEKAHEFIEYTIDGVTRMRQLIQDLLEYSKVGTKGIDLKPANFSTVVEKAVYNLKSAIEENDAMVTYEELPTIMADIPQMISLLQNLISNAIKFHGTEIPRVSISAARRGSEWVFSVKDNGIGIDPDSAERIFVVFQRLHTKEEYPGTGIGLAVCKRIVERHGGRIWVESQPGKGSTFFFTLPAV